MYPEVERYLEAATAARAAYHVAVTEAERTAKHEDGPLADCPACKAAYDAADFRDDIIRAAWAKLAASPDSLVRWIAEHCWEYHGEAEDILRALPAPMSTLDRIAASRAWCEDWDRFRLQAEVDGVLPSEEVAQS